MSTSLPLPFPAEGAEGSGAGGVQTAKASRKQSSLSGKESVKNLPAMQETQETWVQSLGREDPLEEKMATLSSILA